MNFDVSNFGSVDNPNQLSVATLEQIDGICLEFERLWRAGDRPCVADFLSEVQTPAILALRQELLLLDVDYRKSLGEQPQASDYSTLFPDNTAGLETAFAAAAQNDTAAEPKNRVNTGKATPTSAPERLGRYTVVEKIGQGGFGIVYRARDEVLQRDVAIKVPHRHLAQRRSTIEMFRKEAQVLARLRHPAIVPIYDVHMNTESLSECFVVSQFMEGGTLAEYVKSVRPTPAEAARITARIANALHYAHGKGLVHRDVKLSNILRDSAGEVYIADFGLALRDDQVNVDDRFAGTPVNMSPEQARGDGHLVDGRTDVYGLGVVFYELLTGHRPFNEANVAQLLRQIQVRPPKPPRQRVDSIPVDLERICLKSLEKRPEDRYSTALDMANELRRFESSRGWSDASKWLTAAAILLVAIGLGWVSGFGRTVVPSSITASVPGVEKIASLQTLAVMPFRNVDNDRSSDYIGWGMSDSLTSKLSHFSDLVVRSPLALQDAEISEDLLAFGKRLLVDVVLGGSIEINGGLVQAESRLVRMADGTVLWSGAFREESKNLFAVQDAIAVQVAQALALQISADEQRRMKRRGTDNQAAYESYVRGRHDWNLRSRDGTKSLRRAIDHYRAAIDADPLYAAAYAGLAESHVLFNAWWVGFDTQSYPRARAAAKRALELDDELHDAHATLALVLFYHDWDWKAAEREFLRAIELNPNYATTHQWYAEMLYFVGRFDESIAQLERAAQLDPLSPVIASLQGIPDLYRRDIAKARTAFRKALNVHADAVIALFGMAVTYELEGDHEKALEYYNKWGQLHGRAHALAKIGRRQESLKIRQQLVDHGPHPAHPYNLATIDTALGDHDSAFAWLEKAKELRDDRLMWLRVDPKLDPLRNDPRFAKLLVDVGIQQ